MTRGPDRSNVYRRWTWLFVTLTGIGCLVGIAVPAGLGWDFANFYDAGRRVMAGQAADLYDPLSLIGGQAPQGRTGFFGAPISALFYVPLAPFSAEAALIVFKIQNVLAFVATFGVLFTFYRRFVPGTQLEQSRFTALFALLCLIYQPFWTIFRVGGQTTPTVLLLLSLGLVAHTSNRLWASALCIVIAALIKPALAPAVLLLLCLSGLQYAYRMAALFAATGIGSLLLLGWPVHATFLDVMRYRSVLKYSWYYNSSLYMVIENVRAYFGQIAEAGALNVTFLALTYGLRVAVVLTVIWFAVQSRRGRWTAAARRHSDYSLTLLFFLLWSPTIWEHYLSLLFPVLIYIVAAHAHFTRPALAIVAMIFIASIGQNLIVVNWLRYGFSFSSLPALVGIGLYKSAPLLLTMVLLWRHPREWLRSHAAPEWDRHESAARPEPA